MRDDVAFIVANSAGIFEYHDFRAILAAEAIFKVLYYALRLKACEYALAIDRVDVQVGGLADGLETLNTVKSEHLYQCRIRSNYLAFTRGDVNAINDIFEQSAVASLACTQTFFIELPLDRDPGQSCHTIELVEFICRRCTGIATVNIKRAYDSIGRTEYQE